MPRCEDWIAYHGMSRPLRENQVPEFGGLDTHREGIHLGSLEQATMRARPGCPILKVKIMGSRMRTAPKRVRERASSWSAITRRYAREGCQALVYLNRYEGMPVEALERLTPAQLDQLDRFPDSKLRQLVPELEDSWILLDPELVEVVEILTRNQAKVLYSDLVKSDTPSPGDAASPGAR